MGKIVKYCAACEEGFAEKFGFCPNCGAHLTAFELNPVAAAPAVEEPKAETVEPQNVEAASPVINQAAEEIPAAETEIFSADVSAPAETAETVESFDLYDDVVEEPRGEETVSYSAAASANENLYQATYQNPKNEVPAEPAYHYVPDDTFHVTVVEEKNVRQRNMLLLGAAALAVTFFSSGVVYSMFSKYLDISAIETPELVAYIEDSEPVPFEEEEIVQKKEDKGGGGGGGGKNEPTPASKGREATQVDKPLIAPDVNMTRANSDIQYQAATTGNRQAPITDEPYGLKNGANGLSNGMGTGGGLGNGNGRGQGNGNGDGLGNGNGTGYGNGNGNGNGDGDGDGDNLEKTLVVKKGESVRLKITSKPRATYTDAARQNQVTGTVVLRVTFLASGQIGGITPVKGLPNGLTEQAIAAARAIRFEPEKRNGTPVAVTKVIEYSFTIY